MNDSVWYVSWIRVGWTVESEQKFMLFHLAWLGKYLRPI